MSLCNHLNFTDCCYCRQSFTSEAKRYNIHQIIYTLKLTRGVTEVSFSYIVGLYSGTVISNSDHGCTAICYFDCYSGCSCIYRILYKFFDNRSRSFYNLACGYFINCMLIKYSNHLLSLISYMM